MTKKLATIILLGVIASAGCYAMPEEEIYIRDIRKGIAILAEADELFDRGEFYKAYRQYERGLKFYPDCPRRAQIVSREITQIGYAYLDGQIKHSFLGTGLFKHETPERGIEIIQTVVRSHISQRYSFLADAEYKIGTWLFERGEYYRAAYEFEYILDNFEGSYWTTIVEFLLAESYYLQNIGPAFDQATLDDAAKYFHIYLDKMETSGGAPGSEERTALAKKRLEKIHRLKAEKIFINGMFYYNMSDWRAARFEFRKLPADFGDTEWATEAERMLEETQARIDEEA